MKKSILTFTLSLILFSISKAQELDNLSYSSEERVLLNNELIILEGNATVSSESFEFTNADKIVINKNTNEIIVSGDDFNVKLYGNGTIEDNSKSNRKTLIYNMKSKKVNFE